MNEPGVVEITFGQAAEFVLASGDRIRVELTGRDAAVRVRLDGRLPSRLSVHLESAHLLVLTSTV